MLYLQLRQITGFGWDYTLKHMNIYVVVELLRLQEKR